MATKQISDGQRIARENKAFLLKAFAHFCRHARQFQPRFSGLIAHRKLNEHALRTCTDAILIYSRLLIGAGIPIDIQYLFHHR